MKILCHFYLRSLTANEDFDIYMAYWNQSLRQMWTICLQQGYIHLYSHHKCTGKHTCPTFSIIQYIMFLILNMIFKVFCDKGT